MGIKRELKYTELFEENRILRGFNVIVLDDWEQKTKKRFITESEQEKYIQDFGLTQIHDSEFFDWWCKINKLGAYAM